MLYVPINKVTLKCKPVKRIEDKVTCSKIRHNDHLLSISLIVLLLPCGCMCSASLPHGAWFGMRSLIIELYFTNLGNVTSRNGEIILSFTGVGNSCHSRDFNIVNIY